MPRQLIPADFWWEEACELMARYDISLREAAAELGVDITIEQAEAIKKRKLFQKMLEEAKTAYWSEIGSSPRLTKELVVGQLYSLANRLAADREDYKAADALLKLAKIQGWLGEGEQTNILAGLSQEDINRMKKRLEQMRRTEEQDKVRTVESVN